MPCWLGWWALRWASIHMSIMQVLSKSLTAQPLWRLRNDRQLFRIAYLATKFHRWLRVNYSAEWFETIHSLDMSSLWVYWLLQSDDEALALVWWITSSRKRLKRPFLPPLRKLKTRVCHGDWKQKSMGFLERKFR